MRPRDLFEEATAGVLQRPGRSALTMLGTILGIGTFVAIIGIAATAGGQIDRRFTQLAATEVTVEDAAAGGTDKDLSLPLDSRAKLKPIKGVVDGGVYWPLPLDNPKLTGVPDLHTSAEGLGLFAADPGVWAAMRPTLSAGRFYDDFHQGTRQRVAVLGAVAAQRLGITRLDSNPAVFIDGSPFTVVGVVAQAQRLPEMLLGVVIPTTTALAAFGPPRGRTARMLIETTLGGAPDVARQVPVALRPDAPQLVKATMPVDPQRLRGAVTDDLQAMFLLLAAVSLIVGAVGIANTTLVAVLERTAEIGLRRSLGARPSHIAAQFLAESGALGALGGLCGTALGVLLVLVVALSKGWTAVLSPWTALTAPFAGIVVGLVAGLYPAMRAARIEPVKALQR